MSTKTTIDIGNNLKLSWNTFDPTDSQSLVFNAAEFKEGWLYGIPLCNSVTGQGLSDRFYRDKILASQQYVENLFGIKLFKQPIFETKDFVREEFSSWGFIKTSWQINKFCSLRGSMNGSAEIRYPAEWISVRRSNSNDNSKWKNLYIVPNGNGTTTFHYAAINYNNLTAFAGLRIIPNYWRISYITGFDRIPEDLINLIGLRVAIEILPQLSQIVGVANRSLFGNTGQSVSLDGLSQNTNRQGGGDIFAARLKQYQEQFKNDLAALKGVYKGVTFDVF